MSGIDDPGRDGSTNASKLFQIARSLRIPGGSDEVQRTTIAEILGMRAKN